MTEIVPLPVSRTFLPSPAVPPSFTFLSLLWQEKRFEDSTSADLARRRIRRAPSLTRKRVHKHKSPPPLSAARTTKEKKEAAIARMVRIVKPAWVEHIGELLASCSVMRVPVKLTYISGEESPMPHIYPVCPPGRQQACYRQYRCVFQGCQRWKPGLTDAIYRGAS